MLLPLSSFVLKTDLARTSSKEAPVAIMNATNGLRITLSELEEESQVISHMKRLSRIQRHT